MGDSVVPWGHEFATLAARFGAQPAVGHLDATCSFADLMGHAAAVADAIKRAGVAPGQPVATFLTNGVPAVWASYGAMLSGACETALNPHLADAELAHCVGLARVRHVITDARSAPRFRALGVAVLTVDELAQERRTVDRAAVATADDWGKLLFTSGTTGKPKGIVHSHQGRWLATQALRATLPYVPGPGSRVLLMTPFSHGASLLTYAYLDHGAAVELLEGVPTERVRDLLAHGAVDAMFAPPTVLAKLTAAFEGQRFEGLRCIFTGTATLTPELYQRTRAIFGPVVRVTYGKSEIFNPITVLPPADCDAYYAAGDVQEGVSLGWPASGVEIEIRDETGSACPAGTVGEIHLRARHMMLGQIDGDGFHDLAGQWHATGDMGARDGSGALRFSGRAGDVIKTGGYKVFPAEIEQALAGAAGSAAIAVVGVPSAYWGEIIVALAEAPAAGWVERAEAQALSLTRHKQPRAYLAVPALPRGAQDKLQRAKAVSLVQTGFRLHDGPHPRFDPV